MTGNTKGTSMTNSADTDHEQGLREQAARYRQQAGRPRPRTVEFEEASPPRGSAAPIIPVGMTNAGRASVVFAWFFGIGLGGPFLTFLGILLGTRAVRSARLSTGWKTSGSVARIVAIVMMSLQLLTLLTNALY
jgi:hypothetical protein